MFFLLFQGCNYTTYRQDNYTQFHLPQHTGDYKYRCEAANGCQFRSTRLDRLKKHKAGGKRTCPKLDVTKSSSGSSGGSGGSPEANKENLGPRKNCGRKGRANKAKALGLQN